MRVQSNNRLSGLAPVARMLVAGMVVAGMVMAMVGSEATAQSYGSWGSSGSYGSSGSSASYGSYGSSGSSASYGSHGSHGRVGLFARMRARRAARHASHGSYGSSGSSASYGSYGSSGSSASYGSSYGTPVYDQPVEVEGDPIPADGTTSIKVMLPEVAKVFVNDAPTTSTGAERSYVSRGLRTGMTYSYNIRVEYLKDGETVSESEQVKLRAGQSASLSFGQSDEAVAETEATEPVETEVKVEVPEDARVFLSGMPTKQAGKVRTFSSTQLASGQQWEGYTIRVELDRDGQTLVREEKLIVEGGRSHELAFDFDSTATAQLAQLDK
jgi:uncharacterized protein (TIGR03000 family)